MAPFWGFETASNLLSSCKLNLADCEFWFTSLVKHFFLNQKRKKKERESNKGKCKIHIHMKSTKLFNNNHSNPCPLPRQKSWLHHCARPCTYDSYHTVLLRSTSPHTFTMFPTTSVKGEIYPIPPLILPAKKSEREGTLTESIMLSPVVASSG